MDKKVIHSVFGEVAGKNPDRIAIETGTHAVTYASLNRYANRLSHLLSSAGCKKGDIVTVIAPSSIQLVAALLAVLKTGGIYLPVDLSFSEKRLRQIFTETFDGYVIVSAEMLPDLNEWLTRLDIPSARVLVVDVDQTMRLLLFKETVLVDQPVEESGDWSIDPPLQTDGDAACYIFYTSGTTGDGKAILGVNASLSHFIHWELKEFALDSYRVSQLTRITFDASLRDIFIPLIAGGTLCIPSADLRNNPSLLLEWIAGTRITLMHCVPSLFRVLTRELQSGRTDVRQFPDLSYLLMAGEMLYAKDIAEWQKAVGENTTLVNMYGATETTMIRTFHRIGHLPANLSAGIPVGKPISNTTVAIIKDKRICHAGEIGEIYVKTPFATKGYYKNDILTRQSFVANPLTGDDGDVVYKTGDLGRYDADGNIEVLGRADSQVKVNGIRVELGEIEKAMLELNGIYQAAVKTHRTDDNITSLIAYYTGDEINGDELRKQLGKTLNEHSIPAYFIHLEQMPLNINGKVDKKALPVPEEIIMGGKDFEKPIGKIEQRLEDFWKDILGYKGIGRNISFFSIGGHSLRAIQLVSRIHTEFGVEVRIADIFEKRTIRELAAFIADSVFRDETKIRNIDDDKDYALSSAQRRLWVLCQLEEGNIAYNMPGVYVFTGTFDAGALDLAFRRLIARHEILRTVFTQNDSGEVRQVVLPPDHDGFHVGYRDLRLDSHREEKTRHAVREDVSRPFDLTQGSLLRATLFHLEDHRWVLAYTMHHIISDAWSMNVLIRELITFYNSGVRGLETDLLPLRIQYRDYAAWQQEQLKGDELKKHRQYWMQQFTQESPVLDLPGEKPRPAIKTYNGGSVNRTIDAAHAEALTNLCRMQECTLFMGLLALVNTLLYRYTGQKDIVIGCPVAGRDNISLEDQIGFYVNTLPLRTHVDAETSFTSHLERTRTFTLEAFEHQAYPFDELVDDLGLQRDMSRNALFDVVLVLQNAGGDMPGHQLTPDGFTITGYGERTNPTSKFDLVFNFAGSSDGLSMALEYNSDIYSASFAARMADHLERLLNAVTTRPMAALNSIDFLSREEKKWLTSDVNPVGFTYPAEETIISLFEKQAALYPHRIALQYDSMEMTYSEINSIANRMGHYLTEMYGAGSDDLIGILLDRSEWLVITMLGVLKSGAAYVPMDPQYPRERIDFMRADSGCKVVIDQQELEKFIRSSGNYDPHDPLPANGPSDLAYVIYTSGTTGRPKGVMIEHRNVVRLFRNSHPLFDFSEKDVWTLFHSYCFDFSVWEMYGALLFGGRLVVVPSAVAKDPALFRLLLEKTETTVLSQTPSAFYNLIDEDTGNEMRLQRLRYVIFGGEALSPGRLAAWRRQYPDVRLINMYGITETTVHVTYKELEDRDLKEDSRNVGRPIPTLTCYVLDEYKNLLPAGVAGELYVGGAGVARGYLKRDELTGERFISSPFTEGERLYRSGDKARRLENGELEYFGRIDQQVKVRGHRIEPGEIESAMRRNALVEDALVMVRKDEQGSGELIAWFTARRNVGVSGMREELAGILPAYMIPAHFIQVERFLLTSNGKIDRKALPSPDRSVADPGVTYVPPVNEMQRILTEVFAEVLKRQPIGIRDDFFALGGDSIKSIQVVSRLRQRGHVLTIRDVMQYPVIIDLADRVTVVTRTPHQDSVMGTIPLSPIQRFFFQADDVDVHHFNQSVLLYSETPLVEDGIRAVLEKLIDHHDALRMVYRPLSDGWEQYNRPAAPGEVFDVLQYEDDQNFRRHCEEIQTSFRLEQGPLFRGVLFKGPDKDRLLLAAHHLIMDGVSWRILFEDLSTLYQQYTSGKPLLLPLKTDSFKYWQQQQTQFAESAVLAGEDEWWSAIAAAGAPRLPVDHPDGTNEVADEESLSFLLDEGQTEALLTQCYKAYRTEVNDVLLTAVSLGFGDLFGPDRLLVNMEGHGREHIGGDADISRTVGWFTSMYPVSFDMTHKTDLFRHLVEVKESLHKTPSKGIGYGILKYLANKNYDLLPEVSFNYLGDFGDGVSGQHTEKMLFGFSGEYHGRNISAQRKRFFLLETTAMVVEGRLQLSVAYSRHQYEHRTIRQLLDAVREHLVTLITRLSAINAIHLTPSDLSYPHITIEDLQTLEARNPIEDIYRLSPLQEGLYFHWQVSPGSADYFEQMSYKVKARLDVRLLKESYRLLVERHAVLRTFFTEDAAKDVLQIVQKKVDGDFRYIAIDAGDNKAVEDLRIRDRSQGFDLHSGSQMRLTILDEGNDIYHFVWSHHHILMDGWCVSILINEFFQIYHAFVQGRKPELRPAIPYSNYIAWLNGIDREATLEFWKQYLAGYETVNRWPDTGTVDYSYRLPGSSAFSITGEDRIRIRKLCNETGVTENTFFQAAWATLLGRYNDTGDVLFGSVVSGRPAELKGVEEMIGLFSNTVPVRIQVAEDKPVRQFLKDVQSAYIMTTGHHYVQLADVLSQSQPGKDLFDHILIFENYPLKELIEHTVTDGEAKPEMSLMATDIFEQNNYDLSVTIIPREEIAVQLAYNAGRFDENQIGRILQHFRAILQHMMERPDMPVAQIEYLTPEEKTALTLTFNDTAVDIPEGLTITGLFEEQVRSHPDREAVICEDRKLSYIQLDDKSAALAGYLQESYGIAAGDVVGLKADRDEWMLIAMLAILKCGCAYIPIDPKYPGERVEYIVGDSNCRILLDDETIGSFRQLQEKYSGTAGRPDVSPDDLAYVIYTSGSTGRPKGVRVTHKNVVNFFEGMTHALGAEAGTLLALTNYTFDISVLELLWTLTKGFKVVIQKDTIDISGHRDERVKPLDFSLFYFGNADIHDEKDKYRLLMEGAKYADGHGYTAVWTPERHFHEFGGLYPSPSVMGSALAVATHNIQIRAGSVVIPLNHPLRVAEEWSVVDNLSGGRAGIACASGWHANDFVLSPDVYKDRQEIMYQYIDIIRRLWQGEEVVFRDGAGKDKATRVYPRPVQKEPPLWITSAGTRDTFIRAGKLGLNLLTHLLGSSLEELTGNIQAYRTALRENGHGQGGKVALMLHTFVGEDADTVHTKAKGPFIEYLRSSLGLLKNMAVSLGYDMSSDAFTAENLEDMLEYAYQRYAHDASLIGTKDSCLEMLGKISRAGVDEIACLIDFGVQHDDAMKSLHMLTEVKAQYSLVKDRYSIQDQLIRHQVTHLQATPSMARLLNAELQDAGAMQTVRQVLLGGEKLPASLVESLYEKWPHIGIYNMYGPTETTIWSTCSKVDRDTKRITIGSPIVNTGIYILDREKRLLPVGIPGEVYIGGRGVARGYMNKPALTKERFTENPYLPGDRMYRTGDFARWLPDGAIEYIGRKDDQVKIRGHRIEPGEIEKALLDIEAIESALVMAVGDEHGSIELAAYLKGHGPLSVNNVIDDLKKTLPGYMIPEHFIQVLQWPLTFNGKIDRKALPSPLSSSMRPANVVVPARNRIEEKLVSIWQQVTGRKEIGVLDDFFRVGGNSIRSMQLISRIRKEFQVRLELKEIFEHTTVEKQAKLIERAEADSFIPVANTLLQTDYPLSYAQLRLWIACQFEESNIAHNNPGSLVFEGDLDRAAFEYAFAVLVRRHEILRTVFRENASGEVRQFILSAAGPGVGVDFHDLREAPEKDLRLREEVRSSFEAPFDLAAGPLLRASLYQVRDNRWVFVYVLHHIISDGWSMNILMNELLTLYNDYLKGQVQTLPALRIQYKDYAVWQQQEMLSGKFDAHRNYWRQQFERPLPVLDWNTGRPRPILKTYHGSSILVNIDAETTREWRNVVSASGVTIFMSLTAVVNILLNRLTGQTDLILGTPIAGRDHVDLENQIGLYLNTLALRTRMDPEEIFTDLLQRVKETTVGAYQHQQYPFDELIKDLDLQRDLSRNVLFDAWIVLHGVGALDIRQERSMVGVSVSDYEDGSDVYTKFDILFGITDTGDELRITMEYNTDIFQKTEAEEAAWQLENIIRLLAAQPGIILSELYQKLDDVRKVLQDEHLQKNRARNLKSLKNY